MQNPINFGEVYAALEMLVESSGGEVLSLNLAVVNPKIMRGSFEIRIASEGERKPVPKPSPYQVQIPSEDLQPAQDLGEVQDPNEGQRGVLFSGRVLVDRMLDLGMTQGDLAEALGGKRLSGSVSRYLHGQSRPSEKRFLAICKAVGLRPSDLRRRDKFVPPSVRAWKALTVLSKKRRVEAIKKTKAMRRAKAKAEAAAAKQGQVALPMAAR